MSAFGGLILTNRGRNLQAKAQAGVQLNFTRIAIGDGDLGGTSILDLNALRHEVKSLSITKLKTMTGGKVVVGTTFSNQDITSGFYWRELGVFAQDPDLGEILYCYGNSGANAEYIPAGGGPDIIEKSIDVVTIVGNASSVTASIDQSLIYATQQDLTNIQNQIPTNISQLNNDVGYITQAPVQSVNGKTGEVTLTAPDIGAVDKNGDTMKGNLTAPCFISNVSTGTAPLQVSSTTVVTNLNADMTDNIHFRVYNGSLQYNDGTGWKDIMISPIKSIQRGVLSSQISSRSSVTVTISSVDISKSVVILSSLVTGSNSSILVVGAQLVDSTSLRFTSESGWSSNIAWQVVEYV